MNRFVRLFRHRLPTIVALSFIVAEASADFQTPVHKR